MKINFLNNYTNFKGHDAGKIKCIYMQNEKSGVSREMESIAKQDGFEIKFEPIKSIEDLSIFGGIEWLQDVKAFITRQKKKILLINSRLCPDAQKSKHFYNGVEIENTPNNLTGGNYFIGKNQNGENWIIIGQSNSIYDFADRLSTDKISETYDVKKENIHYITSPRYHLDMTTRPIGYPYILVNDPRLVEENMKKLKSPSEKNKVPQMFANPKHREEEINKTKRQIRDLEKAGFIVLPIAGVYGSYSLDSESFNFMNAVVNKHDDNSISYISNSTQCEDKTLSKLQTMFQKDLEQVLKEAENQRKKKKLPLSKLPKPPKLKNTYFVSGNQVQNNNGTNNEMMYKDYGIHCLCLEEMV